MPAFLCSVLRGIPRFSLFCAPPCISAPVSILPDAIRPFRMSFPRHRMPVFFPLYGEVGSSLLRFNPATISRPLRTSTSRPFRISIPRHSMPAFILSIPPFDVIRLFRADRLTADTLVYISHTRVWVYSFRKRVSACQPSASTLYIAISIYLL